MCLENDYRTYREVIAAGIQILRPHTEVVTAELDVLKEEVRHFDPHLMICSLPPFLLGQPGRTPWPPQARHAASR